MDKYFGPNAGALLNTLATKAKAFAQGVSEIELKVLEATNEDKWGPHGNDMKEIARAAQEPEKRRLIMGVIWERLQESEERWRLCYKALLLCEYLIKQGPMRVVEELQSSAYVFERLRDNFHYKDPEGRDQGINVRQRARELAALLSSTQKIHEEREKARANANKYTGVSAAEMRGYGGYGSSSSYSAGGGYSGGSGYQGGSGYSGSSGDGRSRSGSGAAGADAGSSSSRQGHGSAARGGSGGHAGDNGEDPFEATRKRIEALKAQGGSADTDGAAAGSGATHVPSGSINMDASSNLFPENKPRMGPKRLSEVKVDPAIAAAFGGGLAPPPRPGSSVKGSTNATPARSTNPSLSTGATPGGSAPDLLDMAAPAAGPAAAAPKPAATAPAAAIDWDNLAFPSDPAAVPAAATPAASAPAAAMDLLAFPNSPTPAAAAAPKPVAAPLDLFDMAPSSTAGVAPLPPPVPKPVAPAAPLDLFDAFPPTPTPSTTARAPAAAPASTAAVFDAFPDPIPAPAPTARPQPPAPPAALFDAFPPPASTAVPRAAPAPPPPPAVADPFADVFGAPAAAPAPMRPAAAPAKPAPSPAASADPFDPFAAAPAPPAAPGPAAAPLAPPAAASFDDPFAAFPAPAAPALAAVPSGGLDTGHLVLPGSEPKHAMLGPRPSHKKVTDPFADLL